MACQIAKCPGYTSQAGQILNYVLQELSQDYDFDLARGVASFTFSGAPTAVGGPYTLPADWLRADNKDVFYTIDGVVYPMIKVELQEWDWLIQQAGIQSFPSYYTTDMSQSPPVMFVWPPPSGAFPVTARYRRQMPDIVTPEVSQTTPWFPNTNYLITRIAGELMKLTNDDRAGGYLGDQPGSDKFPPGAAYLLKKYMEMKDDRNDIVDSVSLDRRRFGSPAQKGLANTKTIGW